MKSIIDRKIYNTETASEIARTSNNFPKSDFHYFEETLYRTKKGSYFLLGEGGPLSKYSVAVGSNGMGGDRKIVPLTEPEAADWLGNVDANLCENLFPGQVTEA